MAPHKTIVFGPTGAVGSAAALTAEELGSSVVLAMRDTQKAIPGLTREKEKQGHFERVHADLSNPDTVHDAVTKTGAKYAYIYRVFGTSDHMKATIEALKSAGIELVVFLSSFTCYGDLKAIEPGQIIPYVHAQVELNLQAVFGSDNFVAVRPGSFASNTMQYKTGLKKGEVKIFRPEVKSDCIAPEDIGRVCGTILAKGPQDEQKPIYLYGPQWLSQHEILQILMKVLGRDVKIGSADEEEATRMMIEDRQLPPPLAKYMIEIEKNFKLSDELIFWGVPIDLADMANIEKYSGRKSTTFEEWATQNKHLFD